MRPENENNTSMIDEHKASIVFDNDFLYDLFLAIGEFLMKEK